MLLFILVLRYSREELLAMHVVGTSPPELPEGTPVISQDSLPPVANLPFDYEEIYKQWQLNRTRGRGRGRTTGELGSLNNNQTTGRNNNGGVGGRGRLNSMEENDDASRQKGANRRGSEDLSDREGAGSGRKWSDSKVSAPLLSWLSLM
jgi:hypothetical protein